MKKIQLALMLLVATLSVACGNPSPPSNMPKGADFVLRTAAGTLDSKTLRGKVLLLFFGYTNCPDICPASLASAAQAYGSLGTEERKQVRLVMISVDPDRDDVEHLKTYAAYFHSDMLGATGTPEEIASLSKAFGAGYVRQPARADGSYAVDHTTSTYIVGKDGKLAEILKMETPKESIVASIRKQL